LHQQLALERVGTAELRKERDNEKVRCVELEARLGQLQERFAWLAAYATSMAVQREQREGLTDLLVTSGSEGNPLAESADSALRAVAVYLTLCAEFAGRRPEQILRAAGRSAGVVRQALTGRVLPPPDVLPWLARACRADLGHLWLLVAQARVGGVGRDYALEAQ